MSTINVTNLKGRGGSSPTLPDGAVVTGVITSTTFDGSLKTTGTPTLGLGVTINSSGVAISGVCTAGIGSFTTLYGSGANLTGVGESIAPWHYNPDVNDTLATVGTGIGITFNKKILAGSGTATLKICNAGVAGTTIQSWGVSSCTFNVTEFTMGALVSNLTINKTYQLDIPEGFIVDSNETSYAGTAYTFTSQDAVKKLFVWGHGSYGVIGNGTAGTKYSSPVQIPSAVEWKAGWANRKRDDGYDSGAVKDNGTLWLWGNNQSGRLGQNQGTPAQRSSPVQVGSDTTWSKVATISGVSMALKTDGTLWAWGGGGYGILGNNSETQYSSPIQIPGTTWADMALGGNFAMAIRTDGTLWSWGINTKGQLGLNAPNTSHKSSPTQIPGTTWRGIAMNSQSSYATKTDNTLWTWGNNEDEGELGLNNRTNYSSPVQVPGTNWALIDSYYRGGIATRTDGTLWTWGLNQRGLIGVPSIGTGSRSSPVQVPGTSWPTSEQDQLAGGYTWNAAIKTDGTLWAWGSNQDGQLGQNTQGDDRSSPVQIGSETDWDQVTAFGAGTLAAIQKDESP